MKKNKLLKVLVLIPVLLALCLFAFASCFEEEPKTGTSSNTPSADEHEHAFGEWEVVVDASCTKDGMKERVCACNEKETEVIPAAHKEVIDAPATATCTEAGLTEGSHCEVCGEVLSEQQAVEALGHDEVIDQKVEALCTETGLTEGSHCARCNEVFVAQEVVPALGHNETVDARVDATCTQNGLTEGSHCARCNTVFVAQEVIPAAHMFDVDARTLDISEDGKTAVLNAPCLKCSEKSPQPYTGTYVRGDDAFKFNEGERVDLVAELFKFAGKSYYAINNKIQMNVTVIIENKLYYFGADGVLQNRVFDRELVTVDGNVYYAIQNEIQLNVTVLINNRIYCFGEDGVMLEKFFDQTEVEIGGNIYYAINNRVQINAFIRIENNIYFYGADGVKSEAPLTEREVTDILGKTYYVINNEIQINVFILIQNHIYFYGENGVKSEAPLTNREITIGNNTYYVINNRIQINAYIRIENSIYFYGANGVKSNDPITEREVTDQNGNTYYVINNVIQINVYIIIENNIYFYGENGVKSEAPLTNREITIGNNTYYVINNRVQINAYIRIENNIYFYGTDGVKNNDVISGQKVTDINGNTYYVINNVIQINIYVLIENKIYYFGTTGATLPGGSNGGYYFGADGAITGSGIYIVIDGVLYEINNDIATPHEHSYAITTVEPTCTEDGYTDHTCRCGDSYPTDVIPKTGHDWNEWYEVTPSTCTQNGIERRTCKNNAEHTEERSLGFADHDYGTLNARVAPTCIATGREAYYQCRECNAVFTEAMVETTMQALEIPKSYHNFVSGACTVCGLRTTTTTGRVYQANSSNSASGALSGVTLRLSGFDDKGLPYSATVTTDSSGAYRFENIPFGTYTVSVEKSGYHTNEVNMRVFYANQVQENIFLVLIQSQSLGTASGRVIDAQTGNYVSGITIYVREGTNVTTGDVIMTLRSDSNGYYTTQGLPEGNYTLQFVDERGMSTPYANNTIAVAIQSNVSLSNQNVTISRAAGEGALRVVLTWGSSPSDLDSHMTFGSYHVDYSNKNSGGVSLDVDDTNSYGPETITVSSVREGYTYRYYVYRYSTSGNSISNSGARVTIYLGNEMVYSIPVASGSGRTWNVFTYSAANGFTIQNYIS